jgi:serine/threonine-protein kinase 24/25/MST4
MEETMDEIEDIQREIHIMSSLQTDFVTKYYGSLIQGSKLWIIMEYLEGGSCLDLLRAGPFEEIYCAVICRELLQGLAYVHEQNKLHRDIKAANLLVSASGAVKIADFGVSGNNLFYDMTRPMCSNDSLMQVRYQQPFQKETHSLELPTGWPPKS